MEFETEINVSKNLSSEEKKRLIELGNAQAELIDARQWASDRRALGFPEETLQEYVVAAQARFELARHLYLNLEVSHG